MRKTTVHIRMPGPEDLRLAAQLCVETLTPAADREWDIQAGELEWTVQHTIDHVVSALGFYAAQLATCATDHVPFWTRSIVAGPLDDLSPAAALLAGVEAMASVLAEVIAVAPRSTRGWHICGMADPSGFAAMGADEILVHTNDLAQSFELAFDPPPELCRRVVTRLFPWAPAESDPWQALLWANGRIALPGHDRLSADWAWHCAPLDEWNGTVPFIP